MFGQNATTSLQNQINTITTTITALEQQLQEAREAKKQLENELQKQLTLIGCGQSALEQTAKFLQMVRATGDSNLETEFWQTLDGMKSEATPQLPEVIIVPSDDEILQTIIELDQQLVTQNYLPIFHLRNEFPNLSRMELDQALYRLMESDKIELSTLNEVHAYSAEEIDAGIPKASGGRLFFIMVTANETTNETQNTEPSFYFENDLASLKVTQLKKLCKKLGLTPKKYKNDLIAQLTQYKEQRLAS